MEQEQRLLPSGFESLEGFVDEWVLDGPSARLAKRYNSDLATITHFYDAVSELAPTALDYLREFQLGTLAPEGERLLRLLLMLQEVAPAVEWYADPIGPDCYDYKRVRISVPVDDVAAQI